MPALCQDGDLQRRQRPVRGPPGLVFGLFSHMARRVLEGLEAGNQDVGEQEQPLCAAVVILAETPQDASGNELA